MNQSQWNRLEPLTFLSNDLLSGMQQHATIMDLQKSRTKVLSRIERLQVGITPHKKLPPEILSQIFVYHNSPLLYLPPLYHEPVWTVIQVCSRWRKIAMAEPLLWNQLNVGHSEKTGALNNLIHDIFANRGGQGAITYQAPWITGAREWENLLNLIFTYHLRLRRLEVTFLDFTPPSLATPSVLFDNLDSIVVSFRNPNSHHDDTIPVEAFSVARSLRNATGRIRRLVGWSNLSTEGDTGERYAILTVLGVTMIRNLVRRKVAVGQILILTMMVVLRTATPPLYKRGGISILSPRAMVLS